MGLALALSAVAAAATVAGGVFVVLHLKHRIIWLKSFIAFGAGFLLAAGLLAMVPEAFAAMEARAGIFILAGYLLTHLFEHTLVPHFHFGEETHGDSLSLGRGSFAATVVGLLVHSFFDGVAIGSGFIMDPRLGWLLFLAIALHKMPDGFTLASVALASRQTGKMAITGVIALAAATLVGTALVSVVAQWAAPALAISAGVAIYVAATDLMPEVNREHGIRWSLLSFAGVAAFYLTEQLLHIVQSH
jgi:ZIP family zinc transporter/zinc and cadmium transporter